VQFLQKSKALLNLARKELMPEMAESTADTNTSTPRINTSSSTSSAGASSPTPAPEINSQTLLWLVEMEKGYRNLVGTIIPYISDIVSEANLLSL
jgi:hypothetical protein